MKITTYPINAKMRRQLIKDGWISRPPLTFTYDRVILEDFLRTHVEALRKDPDYNVRSAIHATFSKCPRYYLVDNFRRLFGLEREADNAFEMDITDIFVGTLEAQIKRLDDNTTHFASTLEQEIRDTEEYQAAVLQLNVWGY